ncbi:MAG: DNA (cytosine-5-)-methyltransferase [Candidatus Zixiibacteriota bacterium]
MRLKTVDLFSGGGGLSLGFMNAGYDVVAAYDNWLPAIFLYKSNFKHPIYNIDLSSKEAAESIREFGTNIIIGGPPCQDFSSAGKRDENLGRADLTIVFANIIKGILPSFFVMENVERAIKSKTFAKTKHIFKEAGYGLSIRILDASLCGVPQLRKRLFVIGQLNGSDGFLDSLLDSRLSSKPMTLRDYFGSSLGLEHYYRHPRSYKRRGIFSIDEPSPTVRGVNRPIPNGYPGHPGDPSPITEKTRPLTTKERSMVQTFPESFILAGNKTDVEQIIGNAVPVKLAEYVALGLKEYFLHQGLVPENEFRNRVVTFPALPKNKRRIAVLNALRKQRQDAQNRR